MTGHVVSLRDIADALEISQQAAQKRATREQWPYEEEKCRGGRRRLYLIDHLPANIQAALIAAQEPQADHAAQSPEPQTFSYDRDALWNWAAQRKQSLRERGAKRAELLAQVMKLIEAGHPFRRAAEAVAQHHNVSAANVRNWYYGVNGKPGARHYQSCDWAAALIPGYAPRRATAECTAEAWDFFRADYLRLEKPAAKACYERLQRAAQAYGWTIPCLRTVMRRIEREIPRAARILAREGAEALKRSYPAQERDHTVFHALQAVNADGHRFDVFVRWPDGQVVRPTMVAWQDIYSGKVLSWRVDKTENTDAVRLSFGDLVERYGIPDDAYLDNGRGFASKWMTGGVPNRYRFKVREEEPAGILTQLQIDVHWTTPYHGQAKPIERAFRDLCEYVAKHPAFSGAYTGNNPTAKPENYGSAAVPLADFLRILDQEITAHNARSGRRARACAGRSFDQTFAESYQVSPIRKATAEQRRLWLLAAESVRVRADGTVTLETDRRNRYWSQQLHELAGHIVVLRFDPQALHDLVHVYALDGRYVAEAQCIHAAGFDDSQAAREHARNRNQFRRHARASLEAEKRMDALEAARLLPTIEPTEAPDSRVVRPWRPAPAIELRGAPESTPLSDDDRAAYERVKAELESGSSDTAQVIETDDPKRRYERWMRVGMRIERGEAVSEDERARYERYLASDECRSMREFYQEFGLTVADGEAG